MKVINVFLGVVVVFSSSMVFALDCVGSKDGEEQVVLKGGLPQSISGHLDSYQFDAIEIDSNNLILSIFNRRNFQSSSKTVVSGRTEGQVVSSILRTSDGIYQLICK